MCEKTQNEICTFGFRPPRRQAPQPQQAHSILDFHGSKSLWNTKLLWIDLADCLNYVGHHHCTPGIDRGNCKVWSTSAVASGVELQSYRRTGACLCHLMLHTSSMLLLWLDSALDLQGALRPSAPGLLCRSLPHAAA